MNRNFTKLIVLCLIAGFSFSACKKDSNNKNTDNSNSTYSMNFTLNGTAVSYSTCAVGDIQVNSDHYTEFVGVNTKSPNNSLQIEVVANIADLKAGQTFQVTSDYLAANTAIFFYSPNATDSFGTQTAAPSGSVTITSVSSTTVKGTFSAKLYSSDDFDATTLKYTVASGTFVAEMPK